MVMGQGRPGGVQPQQRHCYMLQMAVFYALLPLKWELKVGLKSDIFLIFHLNYRLLLYEK